MANKTSATFQYLPGKPQTVLYLLLDIVQRFWLQVKGFDEIRIIKMSLKVLALLFVVLLAANALKVQRHERGRHEEAKNVNGQGKENGQERGPPPSWEEEFVEAEGEGEGEFGPALSAQSQAKITEFMLNEDSIRAELIANAIAETPELSWLADISAENQKAVFKIFMKYSEDAEAEADPTAMIAELSAIEEVQPHIAAWIGVGAHHLFYRGFVLYPKH